MRYVKALREEFTDFHDAKRNMDYWLEKDPTYLPFGGMNMDEFNRKYKTLAWLIQLNHPSVTMRGFVPEKPTGAEIIEVAKAVAEGGHQLRSDARKVESLEYRKEMQRRATNRIKCEVYYTELVESGFFDNKEIHRVDREVDKEEGEQL